MVRTRSRIGVKVRVRFRVRAGGLVVIVRVRGCLFYVNKCPHKDRMNKDVCVCVCMCVPSFSSVVHVEKIKEISATAEFYHTKR